MTKTLELPTDQFSSQLKLSDGARIIAEVRGKMVYLTVIEEDVADKKESAPENFAEKWAGKFAPLLESDLSDDPRAEAILSR